VVETGSVLTVGGQYRDLISLVMIVVILLARPNGLFGSRGRDV
jgi:branched-subunit amino acid ABC-type transport system permease component